MFGLFNVNIPYRGGPHPPTLSPRERGSAGNSLLRDAFSFELLTLNFEH